MLLLRGEIESFLVQITGFNATLVSVLTSVILIVLWILVAYVFSRFLKARILNYFKKKKGEKRGNTLGNLINGSLMVLFWFIIILAVLDEIGFEITPILASAGIFGLAIGFGSQNLVKDVVSGFFLIVDNAFNIGETVEINGYRGKVTQMNLRVTHVTNFLGSELIINNGSINQLINWSRNQTVAVVEFGVAYDTDLEQLNLIMPSFLETTQNKYEDIVELPTFLGVTNLSASSIDMRIIAKTTTGNHFAIERHIRRDVVIFLKSHGFEIPFPQVVVHQAQ